MRIHPKRYYRNIKMNIRNFFLNYCLPDKMYLQYRYRQLFDKKLNLKNPRTFNEKIQWLKLYDRNPEYHKMTDKYAAKEYVASIIGEEYIIPTFGVWDKFEDIDFNTLPDQFVLKCTHDSGSIVICTDRKNFDFEAARKKLSIALKVDYYHYENRQWGYKGIKPRIIAEKYIADEDATELKDYKFFCFNGIPKIIQVDFDRFISHKRNMYSTNWELIEMSLEFPNDPAKQIQKPKKLDAMLLMAEKLSQGIPHVRIDLYITCQSIYFGEMTFYHGGGTEKFTPEIWDNILGSWIELPQKKR